MPKKTTAAREAPPQSRRQMVRLDALTLDNAIQPRMDVDPAMVEEYAAAYADGQDLGPLLVVQEGSTYWLVDGFHRHDAATEAGVTELPAEVRQGTRREALLAAVGANKHGLRLSTSDKRRVVLRLLEDPEWRQWSDREIARQCGVGHPLVGQMRALLVADTSDTRIISDDRLYRTKHGGVARMRTGNIGATPPSHTQVAETIQQELAAGKTPEEAVRSAQHLWPDRIGEPTPLMAYTMAKATGGQIRIKAQDGHMYDGSRSPEDLAQAQRQWNDKIERQRRVAHALETLALLEDLDDLLEDLGIGSESKMATHLPRALEQLTALAERWQAYTAADSATPGAA